MSTFLRPSLNSLSIVVLLALIASLGLLFFTDSDNKDSIKIHDFNSSENLQTMEVDSDDKTIATAWQWEEVTIMQKKV